MPEGGLIVASTDVLLSLPALSPSAFAWPSTGDVVAGLSVSAPSDLGPNHGVFVVDPSTHPTDGKTDDDISPRSTATGNTPWRLLPVTDFLQKASLADLEQAGAVHSPGTPNASVLLDSGVLYFSRGVVLRLLTLSHEDPISRVTLRGVERGLSPVRFELYSDILLCMNPAMHEANIVDVGEPSALLRRTRQALYRALHDVRFFCIVPGGDGGEFIHLGTTTEYLHFLFAADARSRRLRGEFGILNRVTARIVDHDTTSGATYASTSSPPPTFLAPAPAEESKADDDEEEEEEEEKFKDRPAHAHRDDGHGHRSELGEDRTHKFILLNSIISAACVDVVDAGALIENCVLTTGSTHVGAGSVLSGLDWCAGVDSWLCPPDMVLQETCLNPDRLFRHAPELRAELAHAGGSSPSSSSSSLRVLSVCGTTDRIKEPRQSARATYLNRSWSDVFERSGVAVDDVWGHLKDPGQPRNLWTARLFPVVVATGNRSHSTSLSFWLLRAVCGSYQSTHSSIVDHITRDHGIPTEDKKEDAEHRHHQTTRAETHQTQPLEPPTDMLAAWRSAVRLSYGELLKCCDPVQEFRRRSDITFDVELHNMERCLGDNADVSFVPFVNSFIDDPARTSAMLDSLDRICSAPASSLSVASRALFAVSYVLNRIPTPRRLHALAGREAMDADKVWADAEHVFERLSHEEHVPADVMARCAVVRGRALQSQSHQQLLHVAHRYEMLSSALVRRCVQSIALPQLGCESNENNHENTTTTTTTNNNNNDSPTANSLSHGWVHVTAPVRVDLAGGWTDTPPICYEHGGAVVNLAVRLDGRHPIGASARLLPGEPGVFVLRTGDDASLSSHDRVLHCTVKQKELADYNDPLAPMALLKAVLVTLGLGSAPAFSIELRTWSRLPTGTGLGVSSILAGCAVAAVVKAVSGRAWPAGDIAACVLRVEQAMTTGGGWQDQVGGLLPGFKLTRSPRALPLSLSTHKLTPSSEFVEQLNTRLLLVFTGAPRLAKNLLQTVVRRWHTGEIRSAVDALIENAERAAQAIGTGDLEALGIALDAYWAQKRELAEGAEPPAIRRVMDSLRAQRLVSGMSLVGAGGGGFLVVLTRSADCTADVHRILRHDEYQVHVGTVCNDGLIYVSHE